jgi:hypothetical protein
LELEALDVPRLFVELGLELVAENGVLRLENLELEAVDDALPLVVFGLVELDEVPRPIEELGFVEMAVIGLELGLDETVEDACDEVGFVELVLIDENVGVVELETLLDIALDVF